MNSSASSIICPYCNNPLSDNGNRGYNCEKNHSFDLSKEGYLNLLPVNKKKSKSPGDNDIMISARRQFLDQGYYTPLIEYIKETIQTDIQFDSTQISILDSGCGEGYYSENALRNIQGVETSVLGTDISKYAIKSAAKKYKNNFYFVSSVYNLPIADNSTNLILSVFSPNHAEEFHRILTDDGFLIIVSPAENHLKELAELIYGIFRPHKNNIADQIPDSFQNYINKRKTFEIHITDSETLLNLLKMTPYYYNTSEENIENLKNCNDIKIICDFNISVFKKNSE